MINSLKNLWFNFRKTILIALGLILFVIGLITFPLPLPIGLPLIIISLVILLRNSEWARGIFRWLKVKTRGYSNISLFGIVHNFLKKVEGIVYSQKKKLMQKKANIMKKIKKKRSQEN